MSIPSLVSADTAQVLLADHWDGPGNWWPVFPILWILFVAAVVTTIVRVGRRNRALAGPRAGEAKLAERFASGEITEQEYRERRAVLTERPR